MGNIVFRFTLAAMITALLATLAHAVFVLPDEITVAGRIAQDGTLRTDVVQDGEETVAVEGTTGTAILNFSDLISGPDTGLGDGLGSGVIVTVWGQHLGSSQGTSVIEYCDSASVCRAGHVYYWKNADGELPSGPANLYESHGMQEIAFSIPDSAMGMGNIRVRVGTDQTTLPFTVRAGNIYHVRPAGLDSAAGTYSAPWLTVAKADSTATAGDTVYIHSVDTVATGTSGSSSYAIYNNSGFRATESNQFSYVGFPNARPTATGKVGVHSYLTTGIVVSKLSVFASNCANDTLAGCTQSGTLGIAPTDFSRVVGNTVTDISGMCASGQSGAISTGVSGGFSYGSAARIYGNHIYDYGCPNSDKLHHTTYFTIRDILTDMTLLAPHFAYNYLNNNFAKNGIHFYDENAGSGTICGQFSDTIHVYNNVVKDQGGNGISYESACGWTNDAHIYNNLLINVGLPVDVDCSFNCGSTSSGVQILDGIDGGIQGDVYVYNNTIFVWDSQNQALDLQSCLTLRGSSDNVSVFYNDNVCYTTLDRPYYATHSFSNGINYSDNTAGAKNAFYTTAASPIRAIPPAFDASAIVANPLLTLNGSRINVAAESPLKNQSSTTLPRDIYGNLRTQPSSTGAIQ